MRYDPKQRAIGWSDVGAGFLLTGAAVAGMLMVLGGEEPGRPNFIDEALQRASAGAVLRSPRNEASWPGEADERAKGGGWAAPPPACPWRSKPGDHQRPSAAG